MSEQPIRKNKAQFKESERICPMCRLKKKFPDRQPTCSYACGMAYRSAVQDGTIHRILAELQQQEGKKVGSVGPASIHPAAPEPPKEKETREETNTSFHVALDATRVRTLEDLIAHCGIDTRIWEVEKFVANKWEMGAKNEHYQIVKEQLFQIKAWFKKKVNIARAIDEISSLKEEAKKYAPKLKLVKRPSAKGGNVAEISIPDIHFGKLAWSGETNDMDYDIKIAVDGFNQAMATLLGRVSHFQFDEILLVVGNDILQMDSRNNATTKGTVVDTDSRYHKVFRIVRRLIVDHIDSLREIAAVRVIVVPGNHDENTAWHLGDSLECWFHNCDDVFVDNEPKMRKYFRHGKVMLMWTHGDKGKRKDYPLLMATEQPEMFGQTRYREIHCGHLHTERQEEQHGVKVRILPSLCPSDYWHSSQGFTGNLRQAEVYVWQREEGLVCKAVYTDTRDLRDTGTQKIAA